MKEKLIELLGLDAAKAEEGHILSAVADLIGKVALKEEGNKLERAIAAKIAQSVGALSREQALSVLEAQAAANKK